MVGGGSGFCTSPLGSSMGSSSCLLTTIAGLEDKDGAIALAILITLSHPGIGELAPWRLLISEYLLANLPISSPTSWLNEFIRLILWQICSLFSGSPWILCKLSHICLSRGKTSVRNNTIHSLLTSGQVASAISIFFSLPDGRN